MAESLPVNQCSGCKRPLLGLSFRCLSCEHFTMCQECLCNNIHPSGLHELHQVETTLIGFRNRVVCDGCPDERYINSIPYYKCSACASYHLCTTCHDKGSHKFFHNLKPMDIQDSNSNLLMDFKHLTLAGEQKNRSRVTMPEGIRRQTSKPDDFRFVIIGETGTGKSATANSILCDQDAFLSDIGSEAVTAKCESRTRHVLGHNITIVDTPGLFDTRKPNTETIIEIVRCVLLVAPGPHAIIFVLRIGRITKQVNDTVKVLLECFGEEAKRYIIVVFTHKDHLCGRGSRTRDIHEHVKTISDNDVHKLLRDCRSRYIALDNKVDEKSEANKKQVQEFLSMVHTMVEENGGKFYSNQMMLEAEARMSELEEKIRKKMEEEFKEREEQLRNMYNKESKEKMMEDLKQEFEARNPRAEANDEVASDSWWETCKTAVSYVPTVVRIGTSIFQILKLFGKI